MDFDHYVAGIFQTAWTLMALVLSTCVSEEREAWLVNRRLRAAPRLALIAVCLTVSLLT